METVVAAFGDKGSCRADNWRRGASASRRVAEMASMMTWREAEMRGGAEPTAGDEVRQLAGGWPRQPQRRPRGTEGEVASGDKGRHRAEGGVGSWRGRVGS